MITEFRVTPGESRKRLDVFLTHREPCASRSALRRLITRGYIRVNDATVKPGRRIKSGDIIRMDTPQPGHLSIGGAPRPLEILYEDEALLAVNKPSGVAVHPTSGIWSGTLLNAVLLHYRTRPSNTPHKPYPGIVHRLDKDTSGVIVIAKTRQAHRILAAQFADHTIARQYEALVWGVPPEHTGYISIPVGRDMKHPHRHSPQTVRPRTATTHYTIVRQWGNVACTVSLAPQTGRTHQLRVHLAALGSPIMGDAVYGHGQERSYPFVPITRLMLHAANLDVTHPETGTRLAFRCPPPTTFTDMTRALTALLPNANQTPPPRPSAHQALI